MGESSALNEQLNLFGPEAVIRNEHELAKQVLAGLVAKYPTRVEVYRKLARHLCYRNIGYKKYNIPYSVSVDDLWEYGNLQPDPVNSGFKGGNGNKWLGSVFLTGFTKVGRTKSKIKGHRYREIPIWVTTHGTKVKNVWDKNQMERVVVGVEPAARGGPEAVVVPFKGPGFTVEPQPPPKPEKPPLNGPETPENPQ